MTDEPGNTAGQNTMHVKPSIRAWESCKPSKARAACPRFLRRRMLLPPKRYSPLRLRLQTPQPAAKSTSNSMKRTEPSPVKVRDQSFPVQGYISILLCWRRPGWLGSVNSSSSIGAPFSTMNATRTPSASFLEPIVTSRTAYCPRKPVLRRCARPCTSGRLRLVGRKRRVGNRDTEYLTRWRMLVAGARFATNSDPIFAIRLSLGQNLNGA
jgi:hypothetical protein